jgi:uncharacterized SAM-binding protein YcdF (DUF218 family)
MNELHRIELIKMVSPLMTYLAISDEPIQADIIWGLGSNETLVAKKAAEFYHLGLAKKIVFSGGNGHRWKDMHQTEAELFKAVAIEENVPDECILIDNKSLHTGENVAFSLKIFDEMELNIRSALLVTIPPFQRRAMITVETHRKSIYCINSPISWGAIDSWSEKHLLHVANLCVGEIKRLIDYPNRGFLQWDAKNIPNEILENAEKLEISLNNKIS